MILYLFATQVLASISVSVFASAKGIVRVVGFMMLLSLLRTDSIAHRIYHSHRYRLTHHPVHSYSNSYSNSCSRLIHSYYNYNCNYNRMAAREMAKRTMASVDGETSSNSNTRRRKKSKEPDQRFDMEEVESRLLPQLFGHNSFRPGQREVVQNLLQYRSTLAIYPTGAGKSLLYMLPSQLFQGITLVVSPLLALMRDQVAALKAQGIAAGRLDSSMEFEDITSTTQDIVSGKIKILYVSPERFNNEKFKDLLSTIPISMFVVDEAHCISDWGHQFRPDYLRLSHFAELSRAPVRLALTATATTRVAKDILRLLNIPAENMMRKSSLRTNLSLNVQYLPTGMDTFEERATIVKKQLASMVASGTMGAGIVFVNKQKTTEMLAKELAELGYNVRAYHGGMDSEQREEAEKWFLQADQNTSKTSIYVTVAVTCRVTSAF